MEVPTVEKFHNHAQHLVEHNLYRISPVIRKLQEEDPKKYKALMDAMAMHIEQHEKLNSEQRQSQQMSQANLQGAKNAFKQR
jgi:hypothetical protein